MMVPTAATVIPLFRMFGKMGLLNTTVGCILPTVSTAFMIFMFRQAAKSFPDEIIEAARIDGVGEWGIYFKNVLTDYEIYLRSSCNCKLYECMEQLHVAIDRITE